MIGFQLGFGLGLGFSVEGLMVRVRVWVRDSDRVS